MEDPVLFPTTFPNILVSPNLGIAVGMACSICSFNLAEICDGTIALLKNPNTTVEELLEIITWKQLGLYLKPIVILNTKGYYDALLQQLEQAAEEQFMRKEHLQIWRVAQTAEEAVQLATSTPMWDTNVRRFAAV